MPFLCRCNLSCLRSAALGGANCPAPPPALWRQPVAPYKKTPPPSAQPPPFTATLPRTGGQRPSRRPCRPTQHALFDNLLTFQKFLLKNPEDKLGSSKSEMAFYKGVAGNCWNFCLQERCFARFSPCDQRRTADGICLPLRFFSRLAQRNTAAWRQENVSQQVHVT